METGKRILWGGVIVACIFGLVVWLTPTKEQADAHYARYCLTAKNTPGDPYAEEQCTLTQVYKMDVGAYDLAIYHHRKSFGHYPLGVDPTSRTLGIQAALDAHYAAHPNEGDR